MCASAGSNSPERSESAVLFALRTTDLLAGFVLPCFFLKPFVVSYQLLAELLLFFRVAFDWLMFRGYDTSELFLKDTLLRTRHLDAEIAGLQKSMDELEKETAVSERQIQRLKKKLGPKNN